jgi:hypothetical protein
VATEKTRRKSPRPRAAGTAPAHGAAAPATEAFDAHVAALGDWRGAMLARVRTVIRGVSPDVVEQWKWRGTPVWSSDGIVCTGETYRNTVKLTFANGASLPDPARLFNASLDGGKRRAIDLHEGDEIDARALAALVRAAVARNRAAARGSRSASRHARRAPSVDGGAPRPPRVTAGRTRTTRARAVRPAP